MNADQSLIRFAQYMRRIPRRAVRCDLYGTVTAVLDERHARNVFAKVSPGASREAVGEALQVLRDRMDDVVRVHGDAAVAS